MLGDLTVLSERARQLGATVALRPRADLTEVHPHAPGALDVVPIAARAPVAAGQLDVANAPYVLDLIRAAVTSCMRGAARALVTAPVQKSVIANAGFPFTGHTEFLAELTGGARPVMLLTGKGARVALVTTHLPLAAVSAALNAKALEAVLRITYADLRQRFRIEAPRMLVLGLNPHAGESGTLGREEIDVIEPTVRKLAAEGLTVTGPVSADTAFTPASLERCDVVVAMYHDQGLPALKALSFGEIVNVTLGLPIVRTSVDHGTALPLAGTGSASPESLFAAVELALELV